MKYILLITLFLILNNSLIGLETKIINIKTENNTEIFIDNIEAYNTNSEYINLIKTKNSLIVNIDIEKLKRNSNLNWRWTEYILIEDDKYIRRIPIVIAGIENSGENPINIKEGFNKLIKANKAENYTSKKNKVWIENNVLYFDCLEPDRGFVVIDDIIPIMFTLGDAYPKDVTLDLGYIDENYVEVRIPLNIRNAKVDSDIAEIINYKGTDYLQIITSETKLPYYKRKIKKFELVNDKGDTEVITITYVI